MTDPPRPGFDVERKITLHEDVDEGLVLDVTPAERLAMVWPLTQDCWALFLASDDHAQREFQRHIEGIRRGRG